MITAPLLRGRHSSGCYFGWYSACLLQRLLDVLPQGCLMSTAAAGFRQSTAVRNCFAAARTLPTWLSPWLESSFSCLQFVLAGFPCNCRSGYQRAAQDHAGILRIEVRAAHYSTGSIPCSGLSVTLCDVCVLTVVSYTRRRVYAALA